MKTRPRIHYRILLLATIFILSSLSILFAQGRGSTPKRVEIPGSQQVSIPSSIVGREYDLYIQLPRFYDDTSRSFPVVYVLDGQWDFSLVGSLYGQQHYDGFVPGLVIVAITWGGVNPNYDSLRAADLTPTNSKQVPQSGNAPKFLSFIKTELIPFVEKKYRVRKEGRTLMGSSYGGLFTLFALFTEPELFTRYVAASPAIGFDNEVIFTLQKNYAESKPANAARLYMAEGGLEGGVQKFQRFADQLQNHGYKSLKLQTKILENIGHSGSKAEGFTRGLQWAFERPSMTFDPGMLKQYEGTYEIRPGMQVSVSGDGGRLSAQMPGNPKITFLAENENSFYLKGTYMNVRFVKDEKGKVVGAQAEQFSGSSFLKKLD